MSVTAAVYFVLLLAMLGVITYPATKALTTKWLRRRDAKQARLREPELLRIGKHLRETHHVDLTSVNLDAYLEAGWTAEDFDNCFDACDRRPEFLTMLLVMALAASGSFSKIKPAAPLDPEGVALWARIGLLDTNEEGTIADYQFQRALEPMRQFTVVGNHTYSAWCYAAMMSVQEAQAHHRNNEPLDSIQTVAALLGRSLHMP